MRVNHKKQQAFSLIEVLVALLICVVITIVLWELSVSGVRARKRADARLQGVQASMVLLESLSTDLCQLYVDEKHPMETFGGNKPGVAFFVAQEQKASTAGEGLQLHKVAYFLDKQSHRVKRVSTGGNNQHFDGSFENIHFAIGGTPDETSDFAALPRTRGVLTYAFIAKPRELREGEVEKKHALSATVIKGALPLEQLTASWRHRTWARNVTSIPKT